MPHYTVTEMADKSGLSPHTLRYYEKEKLLLDVPRDGTGRRLYGNGHLAAIRFISALRATGMPIATIKTYIRLYRSGNHTADARLELLEVHESDVVQNLQETRENLKLIRKKIAHYKASKN